MICLLKVLFWIYTLFNSGSECCENQTILCRYSQTRPEVCENALCSCYGTGASPPTYHKYLRCDGVLNEIPIGQFQEELWMITMVNNNISTVKNGTFNGIIYLQMLYLQKNRIKNIETSAFTGIGGGSIIIDLSENLITTIREQTFDDLPGLDVLKLTDNRITDLKQHAFRNLPNLSVLYLNRNRIKTIGPLAFGSIPRLSYLNLADNEIAVIENQAFSRVSVDTLDMSGAFLRRIERNAFYNVTVNSLVLGMGNDTSIQENFIKSDIGYLYFLRNKDSFICNCTMMWIVLWLQEWKIKGITFDISCKAPKKMLVRDLTMNYFSHCKEMPEHHECSAAGAVIMECSFSFVSGDFVEWIHSRNGRHIRTLHTLTNILSIPFCSLEDIGDYTCVRTTHYTAVPLINTTTTLHVKGRPVVTNRTSFKRGQDLVLSVTISSPEPVDIQWFLDNIQLVNGTDYMINTSIVPITLLQYSVSVLVDGVETRLTIRNYRSLSTRAYTCRVSNSHGTLNEILVSRPIDIILPRNTLCHSSSRLDINCTLNADEATPKYFIHTVGGKTIRQLQGTRVNNTYTLVIPFCSYLDIGDYTCYWDNDASGREFVTKTTTLTIDGPPIILQHTETMVDGFTVLSVFFHSQPYPSQPKWFLNNVVIVPSFGIQQTTSFSKIEIQMYRITAVIDGFISNLTMNSDQAVFGEFKCVVSNEYGVSEKTIIRRNEGYTMEKSRNVILPTVLGCSVAGLAIILIILVVVCVKRRKKRTKNASDYIDAIGHTSNDDNVYNTVQMSRITEQHNYIEINE